MAFKQNSSQRKIWKIRNGPRIKIKSCVVAKSFFFFFSKKIYLFFISLDLCCFAQSFPSCDEWGLLFVAVHELFIAVCGLFVAVCRLLSSCCVQAAEHRLSSCGVQAPKCVGSVVVAHGLNCPAACRILVP